MADGQASTSRQQPNTSTPLLSGLYGWNNTIDNLTSDFTNRSLIPSNTLVPTVTWWQSLWSNCCFAWENVRELWNGPLCGVLDGKLAAFLSCTCLLCRVLVQETGARHNSSMKFSHSGITYLFVLLCCTVTFNLVELKMIKNPDDNETPAQHVRQYFLIVCMIVAIVGMLYLHLFTYGSVQYETNEDAPLSIYFRGGLYVFGFASMVYSICLMLNDITCGHNVAATVRAIKALYIVSQTLFLNHFYQARIPGDTAFVQVVFAHLLGTNLALWFWVLCTESTSTDKSRSAYFYNCTNYPIKLDDSRKYFYPLFVEYLILAASIIYVAWYSLLTPEIIQQQQCPVCIYRTRSYRRTEESHDYEMDNVRNAAHRLRRHIPNCGYGLVLGACFAAIMLVLILVSFDSGQQDHVYFIAYSWGTLVFYISEIGACYVAQVSLQSQRSQNPEINQEHLSLNHDDVLLYISLGGILLLEGFHMFSLLLKGKAGALIIIVDIFGVVQHLSQTATLVNIRHHQRPRRENGQNSMWICECVLFLLITNIAWWFQNSFFLGDIIDRPGENDADLEDDLKSFNYILKPMAIFFRFHSATCFYHAWSIFKA